MLELLAASMQEKRLEMALAGCYSVTRAEIYDLEIRGCTKKFEILRREATAEKTRFYRRDGRVANDSQVLESTKRKSLLRCQGKPQTKQ